MYAIMYLVVGGFVVNEFLGRLTVQGSHHLSVCAFLLVCWDDVL